jgi:PAS domain S-box-containing protein
MSSQTKKGPMNILIVDDQEDNRYLLRSLLQGSGYQVAEAPNGKKALEILAQGTWDLVISDILMPVMDGYELCREIRSSERLRHLPFIFYTATYIDQRDESFAMKLGADRFYRKPLDPPVLLENIRNFMEEISKNRGLPRPAIQGNEKEILKLYSERLIHKLETKMEALEKEVAERKRIEEALRESEKKYRLIAENTVDVIAITDLALRFTYVSPSILRLRGFTSEETLTQSLDQILTPASKKIVDDLLAREMELEKGGQADPDRFRSVELEEYRKDGTTVWTEASLSFLRDGERRPAGILSVSRDITERKRAEAAVLASLKEKEVLLREIHHRVKNNMQVISSLISLPAQRPTDPETERMLRQLKLRIRAMAMVHEKLYQAKDLARIDFADFLNDLAIHQFSVFSIDADRISLALETDPLMLPVEIAVPCGLIAGEILSNALKHAFPEERRGTVVVGLRRLAGAEVLFNVRDNGVGFPAGLDIRKAETMGLVILNALIGQIDGRVEILRDGGTDFRVFFPAPRF